MKILNRQLGGGLGEDFIKCQVKMESNKLLNIKCNAEWLFSLSHM